MQQISTIIQKFLDKIPTNSYKVLAFIYGISFVLLLSTGLVFLGLPNIRKIFDHCFISSPPTLYNFVKNYRGSNYYLRPQIEYTEDQQRCLYTSWALTHTILYFIIGFILPDLFWQSLIVGIIFEYLEDWQHDCHDILDVVWNSIGFILGAGFRRLFFK